MIRGALQQRRGGRLRTQEAAHALNDPRLLLRHELMPQLIGWAWERAAARQPVRGAACVGLRPYPWLRRCPVE